MATITIDPNYGYVLLAATSTFVLGFYHTLNTGAHRRASKVQYPAAYAPASRTDPEAFKFNCAQRAHAHYIENQVQFVPALLLAGWKFPLVSAALGALWTLSRLSYVTGYSQGNEEGKGRYSRGGSLFWVAQLGAIGLAAYNGLSLALEW